MAVLREVFAARAPPKQLPGRPTRALRSRGHLWSLAVEEQFYLLWPLVVWLLPAKRLAAVVLSLIALGPIVRWFGELWLGYTHGQTYLASQSHVDAFACGALVSWLATRGRSLPRMTIAVVFLTWVLGLWVQQIQGLAIRALGYPEGLYAGQAHIWGYSMNNLSAALLIACLVRGHMTPLGHPALAYVGRVSYALYLFQRPIKGLYLTWLEAHLLQTMPVWLAYGVGAALCLTVALILAALSDRFFERPLRAWRDRIVPRRLRQTSLSVTS